MEPLLLGVCDAPCPEVHVSPYENKVGGYPDLYLASLSPCCRVCGAQLMLLVQVYCPLIGSTYHRTLYVYCCTRRSCWPDTDSWLVLRSQMKEAEVVESKVQSPFTNDDWCEGASDWGSDSTSLEVPSVNSVTTPNVACELEGLSLASIVPPQHSSPCYPSFYINVEYGDGLAAKPVSGHCGMVGGADGEEYEKGMAKHGDHAFQKFHKAISNCPRQIIRYQRGGDPLLITDNPQYVPKTYHCKNCGSQCVFEFQILPQLIHILQSAIREKLHDGSASQYLKYEAVEYGTVLVYTCSKSCWSNNTSDSTSTNNSTSNNLWVEEVVVVQPDLDTPLIDTIAV